MAKTQSTGSKNFSAVFKKYFNKKDALLVPNILCYLRIVLVVVFFVLYITPITIAGNEMANVYISFAFMIIAAYTDFLDGFIARKFDQTSDLGKILDPLSDIFLQGMSLIAICTKMYDYLSVWIFLTILIVKELCQAGYLIFLARHGKSLGRAHWFGKVASFLTYVIIAFLLVCSPFMSYYTDVGSIRLTVNIVCYVGVAALGFAWGCYTIMTIQVYKTGDTEVPLDENGRVIENPAKSAENKEETISAEEESVEAPSEENTEEKLPEEEGGKEQ